MWASANPKSQFIGMINARCYEQRLRFISTNDHDMI